MAECPIFIALKKGQKFTYNHLRTEADAVSAFRKWWWEQADRSKITRPEIIEDSDPILTKTSEKKTVDTLSDDFMFPPPLLHLLKSGALPLGDSIDRNKFRQAIADQLALKGLEQENPIATFTGGGYGAGKTNTLQFLAKLGKAPGGLTVNALQGVDYCKQLIPEFNQLRMVGDGRASEITQDESRLISDMLFAQLTHERLSFGWDSSMSNLKPTLKKIRHAQKKGYRVHLHAVLTEIEVAVSRAMQRAKDTRRFPPPAYLRSSHESFHQNLPKFLEVADSVMILENTQDKTDSGPRLLAHRDLGKKDLTVTDPILLSRYITP